MTHDELRDQYELYAMGVLEEPERSEIRDHLNRGCEDCMAEVRHAREMLAMLGGAVTPVDPPARLRKRILASVGVEPQRGFGWAPWLAFAATLCLVAAVYFAGRQREYANEIARVRSEMRQQTVEMTRLNEAFAILNGADTTEATFGKDKQAPPRGKVFVNPNAGVLLIASNLPPAPAGKVYEMWVIPKGGNPVPAGLFQSESGGTAMHIQRGPVDVRGTGAVAVTLENEGGAPQPTSTPLIVAPIGD
jgi:anti-sigma-K factor RskA